MFFAARIAEGFATCCSEPRGQGPLHQWVRLLDYGSDLAELERHGIMFALAVFYLEAFITSVVHGNA